MGQMDCWLGDYLITYQITTQIRESLLVQDLRLESVFVCGSKKHLKRECSEWKKNKNEYSKPNNQGGGSPDSSTDGYDSADGI